MGETFDQKCRRNVRVSARYDELMREGKHGHYETMFQVVREEAEAAYAAGQRAAALRAAEICRTVYAKVPSMVEGDTMNIGSVGATVILRDAGIA